MRSNRPVGLVERGPLTIQLFEQSKARFRSTCFRHRSGATNAGSKGVGKLHEMSVETGDSPPVGDARTAAVGMHRLNRRLKLKASQSPSARRDTQLALRLPNHRRDPFSGVLL